MVPVFWRSSKGAGRLITPQMVLLYRGVTKPRSRASGGWLASKKEPRLWKNGFATQDEAAEWLAKALGVKKSSLLRVPVSRRPRRRVHKELVLSKFRGVVLRHRPHGFLWEARRPGGASLGCYGSEIEAAKALARVLGVPVKSLKRKVALTRTVARRLFEAAYQVFQRYVPGDIEKTGEQERTCQSLFNKDRCVIKHAGTSIESIGPQLTSQCLALLYWIACELGKFTDDPIQ